MRFLIDAQLPIRLARLLREFGYDTIHTRELPAQNKTPDSTINLISLQDKRIVITKDSDFVNSFLASQKPYKLLLISTGNIKNSDLEALFVANLGAMVKLLDQHSYIEVSRDSITVHC
ncbi:DUF5615 family PIN-like protein [Synechococcus elongatus]|uniref:DUF5615 domain-containing protein n=2 Tax=Synechococcus elongatus TaxID=32046 RepID=Q31QV5_SYNE7|nr:DUF5615 family PIN-like protein [Synechococcus elongatus]ABB56564.1 conserved hypothetical protein [Synechococcus elongatus PCC 7942 = FACHB-805]AJD56394.1 hypothetical protein M744_00290 [Synechococcus elongatus UTEX 2973]MBD2588854.1 DUF5615 family PIN-like protein [Synechococcus elongatus FACHB-242]MBD2689920.1 DUF5615 family PIN-like protein [Synechococcus elongatus FACHB-1061]MBD2706891.1 DUF5615 family PIN-like protein [Synechococcus elongatus PCC 7942 = FACHB-805]